MYTHVTAMLQSKSKKPADMTKGFAIAYDSQYIEGNAGPAGA